MNTESTTTIDTSSTMFPMFKTEQGYNVNVTALAKAARDSINAVRLISIPSIVREQKRRGEMCESPTLPEYGGSRDCEHCLVVGGIDGKPVNIDDVVFVYSDPNHSWFNHGIAVVAGGTYFGIGWKRHTDSVILLYRVLSISEYTTDTRSNNRGQNTESKMVSRPIAKLNCELVGHSLATWRGQKSNVPEELASLFCAVELRLSTDIRTPVYMDVIRMVLSTSESQAIAERMKQGGFGRVEEYSTDTFMSNIYSEIIDIRESQYRMMSSDTKRKVEPLKAVETIELDREQDTITVEMVIPRTDDTMFVHYRVVLTPENYLDDSGRMVLERGLVLRCQTFDALRAELQKRSDKIVTVNLVSIR